MLWIDWITMSAEKLSLSPIWTGLCVNSSSWLHICSFFSSSRYSEVYRIAKYSDNVVELHLSEVVFLLSFLFSTEFTSSFQLYFQVNFLLVGSTVDKSWLAAHLESVSVSMYSPLFCWFVVTSALPSGLGFEVLVCTGRPRSIFHYKTTQFYVWEEILLLELLC